MTKRIAGLALMALVMIAVSQPALAGERVQNVDQSGQAAPSAFLRVIEHSLPWQATALLRVLIGGPVLTPAEEMVTEVSIDTTANGVGGCSPRAGVGGCKL